MQLIDPKAEPPPSPSLAAPLGQLRISDGARQPSPPPSAPTPAGPSTSPEPDVRNFSYAPSGRPASLEPDLTDRAEDLERQLAALPPASLLTSDQAVAVVRLIVETSRDLAVKLEQITHHMSNVGPDVLQATDKINGMLETITAHQIIVLNQSVEVRRLHHSIEQIAGDVSRRKQEVEHTHGEVSRLHQ